MKKFSTDKALRIGIVALVNPPEINGLSQYIIHLFKALKREQSNHTFFLITNNEFSTFFKDHINDEDLLIVDIPHHPRWIMRPVYFFWQNFLANRFNERNNLDILHIPNAVPLFKKCKVPIITTIHDLAEFSGYRNSGMHKLFRIWVTKLAAFNSKSILTVSEFTKKEIIEKIGVSEKKISVSYLGNTLNFQEKKYRSKRKEQSGFLFISGKGKNLDQVVKSFLFFNKNKDYVLNIVGESQIGIANDRILCHGKVSEKQLIDLYRKSIALLYPSFYEGFGLPILEAMCLSVPVITSNRASMLEVGGDAVLLVNPESSEELVNAMISIAENDEIRFELLKKSEKRKSVFSWSKTAARTLEVYKNAISH